MSDSDKTRTMFLGEDYVFTVGEKCFIVVDDVNSPTGTWEGEVTEVSEPGEYTRTRTVKAKITDPRVKTFSRGGSSYGWYFERAPTVNYRVYPFNTFTVYLFDRIERLEGQLEATRNAAALREEGMKRAIVALATGQAEERATAAYQKGLREATEAAAKKAAAAKSEER